MPLAWLDGLAGVTGPNILIDECSHPRPVERAGEALVCLISSEMAGCGAIMGFFEQVRPEGALRDVQPGRGWSLFLVEEVVSDFEVSPGVGFHMFEQTGVLLV